MAYMQVQDGAFAQATPVKFISSNDLATTSDPGVVLLADETAEKNPTAARALAPANVYKLCNFRIISTAYEVGNVVACTYHADLQLKCTQAGTTSADPLDTSTATAGQEIVDGGVKWLVETLGNVKTINGEAPDASGNINIQTGLNLLTRNKAYTVGDIAYSPNLPSWAFLECTLAGTTGAAEPSFTSVQPGGTE